MKTKRNFNRVVTLLVLLSVSFTPFIVAGCNESIQTANSSADASVRKLLPEAAQIIRNGLLDEDPRARTNAIEVVASTGQTQFMPIVEKLLTDEIVPVRFSAALAVGDTKYHDSKRILKMLYKSSDENTRLATVYALYKLGDKSKLATLAEAVSSKDLKLRANAALLLGRCTDKSVLSLLYWAKDDKDSDDRVRFQAVEAIARLGDENIYSKLWTMILNINADDRILGLRGMGALGTELAQGALTSHLSDEVLEVRLVAAAELGRLGYPTGEPEVIDVFTKNLTAAMQPKDAERVNVLAAMAIGQIRTAKLTKYLPKLLKNESKFVRLTAAKAVFLCQTSD